MPAFWTAYVTTRPLGASLADWMALGHARGGLGFASGRSPSPASSVTWRSRARTRPTASRRWAGSLWATTARGRRMARWRAEETRKPTRHPAGGHAANWRAMCSPHSGRPTDR
ncbi:hypothetical protein ACF1FE_22515 [Streptomyces griseofuscus]|uniref:hypothetical protein n=1 Tax=Streptomyces griseofuscus TaxID=146922 RepID=UPI0036FD80FE